MPATEASLLYNIKAVERRAGQDRPTSSGSSNREIPYHEGLWETQTREWVAMSFMRANSHNCIVVNSPASPKETFLVLNSFELTSMSNGTSHCNMSFDCENI